MASLHRQSISRRRFLERSACALALSNTPIALGANQGSRRYGETSFDDILAAPSRAGSADLHELAHIGLAAAKRAGASYADVVFCSKRQENWIYWNDTRYPAPNEIFTTGVGLRALVNGYWGFSGVAGIPDAEQISCLGTDATAQAKCGALGPPRVMELVPAPIVPNGNWIMPIKRDPFLVSRDEKIDFITAVNDFLGRERLGIRSTLAGPTFEKDERTFASTDGTFTAQTLYTTSCSFQVDIEASFRNEHLGSRSITIATPAGAGWEYLTERGVTLLDRASWYVEQAARSRYRKPVDIGRYDVVFDAEAMASILSETIGPATELDRVLGYEANGAGTSFLNDPLTMLDTYVAGSPLVTITANRSMKGGVATVKWDDEGVEPSDVPLVTNGMLTGFQSTRESASVLAPHFRRKGLPIRSSGGAGRLEASQPTRQWASNLVMLPGKDRITFEDMVAATKRGYAVMGSTISTDQQALNASGRFGLVYEIRNGTLGERVQDAGYLFRTPEFLKNIVAVGGWPSAESYGLLYRRNDVTGTLDIVPRTVMAPPVTVTRVAMIDTRQRA